MSHITESDDINVLAPPSSLQTRKCANRQPSAHISSRNNDSNQISKHRPRLTSHKAIMQLNSLHSVDRDSEEQDVKKRQNFTPRTNADNSIPSNDASSDLFFTPPGRTSYLPGSNPRSVGLNIDATSVPLPLPPRQAASTPLGIPHGHSTPFTAQDGNVDHLCIANVFDRPQCSHQDSSTPVSITTRPFVLKMRRSWSHLDLTSPIRAIG